MTPEQMMALGTAFAAYLRIFEDCIAYCPTFEHLHAYCRGLLSDLPRKSVEPIALACGTAVRTLQEFLRDHVWDHFRMRDQLQRRLAQQPALNADAELGTLGVIDETSVAKKGTKTPGVRRQYCGARGKIDNCIVTVHLGIVRGLFKTLIDAALFLPKVWSEDRTRCREAKIPDDVVYRPKWRIALEQLTRAIANGLTFNWLTFDEYYGSKPAFLEDLDARSGMYYVGEIPCNFRCLATRPRGKKPKKGWKGKRVDNLARFSSAWNQRDWQSVSLARLTLDNQEWEVRAGQVYLVRRGELSQRTYWLIVARNVATGELKYFISNAPADTPVEKLLRVAFTRWNVEHTFRVAKSEIGFGHFEGRSYVALMRHMILCLVVMGFVAEHTDRLRGEKSRDHDGAGMPGVEPALPDLAGESSRHNGSSKHGRGHCLSPAAQPRCANLTPTAANTAANVAL
jgi:SRSO17 transposase